MNSRLSLLIAITLSVLLAACVIVPAKLDPEAFGKGKRYAIVTIASHEKVTPGSRSLGELLTGRDSRPTTEAILEATKPTMLEVFSRSPHFELMPEKQMLRHRAYRNADPDPATFMGVRFNTPKDYKFFKTDEKFAILASELGVDGVIFVGVTYNGFISGSDAFGQVDFVVTAVDRTGTKVWKEAVFTKSNHSTGHRFKKVDYRQFEPLLIDATGKASVHLVNKLDEKIAGGVNGFNWDPERLR